MATFLPYLPPAGPAGPAVTPPRRSRSRRFSHRAGVRGIVAAIAMVSALTKRLVMGLALLVAVVIGGGVGYYLIGRGQWSFADCVYMTVITVTTVGYGEVLRDMDRVAYARGF